MGIVVTCAAITISFDRPDVVGNVLATRRLMYERNGNFMCALSNKKMDHQTIRVDGQLYDVPSVSDIGSCISPRRKNTVEDVARYFRRLDRRVRRLIKFYWST